METVRISFDVPYTNGISVKELTDRARHFVMELMSTDWKEESPSPASWALSPHADDEITVELDRRWNLFLQHPDSAIPHERVMEEIKSLL